MRHSFWRRGGMGQPRLLLTFSLLLSALALLLAACGGDTTSSTQSKTGGNLAVGLNTDVVTLDPVKSTALVDRQVMLNIYDTLVHVNEQNALVPDLATSWSYSSPTQLVFTLRTDVKFQDGTPFNADAVVFNINRILSNQSSPRYSELSSVKSVQTQDASHVVFNLKKAFSPLLATLSDRAGMILSPTAVQKLGANLANAPTNAGSGPFTFGEWAKGDHLTIKKNSSYWQKDGQGKALPYLDTVRYRPITNGSLRFSNLQTGTINLADGLDPNDISSAKSNPDLTYKQAPALSFFGFMLNTKVAPLDNLDVRQAIEWGVNRQEILDTVLKGNGVLSSGPIPPTSWAYDKNFKPYTYDISKAKAALAKAGKTSITFTLLVPSGSPLNTQEAQFIQSELQPAGITVNIKQETFATILSDTSAHNFQAALIGWSGRPDPDGNLYSWFHTGGGNNNMQYSNPQTDLLLEKARASSDQQERATDYQQAQQLILQDASYIFINHGVSVQATTTSVKNFTILPTGIYNFATVTLAS
ncbi:extracellular solute-binding protein family 5 [Ktedonobacter racemifer DSM 44963]|uniref:Extracellular solute-binding protein family 5 n=2 Tax=Ktedonobacter racemifer TaxID=363277 RepID=D6U0E5_KTERA|nr:extracellular solute-binding protein family 5 [Ktedonobacter racemifer DSM 44963]